MSKAKTAWSFWSDCMYCSSVAAFIPGTSSLLAAAASVSLARFMETQEFGTAREIPCADPPIRRSPAGIAAAVVVAPVLTVGLAEVLAPPVAALVAEALVVPVPGDEHAVSAKAMLATASSARPLLLTGTPAPVSS
jgi:hypothetical protein